MTYFACTGWQGYSNARAAHLSRTFSPSRPGEAFPLYHPLADACEWEGARVIVCTSTDALAAVGLAVRSDQGTLQLLVANLTPRWSEIVIEGTEGAFGLRRLDGSAAVAAGSEAVAYRSRREPVDADGSLSLAFAPYEVVRLDGSAPT